MATDRRQLILDAAAKSFAEFGYKATTMDQVAGMANVAKGTIYTFFKNKEELFHEIINKLIAEMKDTARNAIKPDRSFFENAHMALISILEYRKQHQLTIKLFQEEKEIGTPVVQDVMSELENAIVQFISREIEMAVAEGEIRPCDPEITAFVMMKLYIALIFDWEKGHEPLSKEKIAELFEMYLLQGLSQ